MHKLEKDWCLYVLECSDSSYYCGVTNNLERRVRSHNSGKGAKYTRSRRPVKVIASISGLGKSLAHKIEFQFKKLSRAQKEHYILTGLESFRDKMTPICATQ